MHQAPLPLAEAMDHSTKFLSNNTFFMIEVVKRMFEHKVSVRQLSGPVGIAHMAGEAAEAHGWYPKFWLAADHQPATGHPESAAVPDSGRRDDSVPAD